MRLPKLRSIRALAALAFSAIAERLRGSDEAPEPGFRQPSADDVEDALPLGVPASVETPRAAALRARPEAKSEPEPEEAPPEGSARERMLRARGADMGGR